MQTPHESLVLNEKRGLLAAVMGNPGDPPGFVDIYDLNEDCRHPQLQSSLPVGLLGHESGLAPDGNTFYATSLFSGQITAVDMTEPEAAAGRSASSTTRRTASRLERREPRVVAALDQGLIVVDTSQIQARAAEPADAGDQPPRLARSGACRRSTSRSRSAASRTSSRWTSSPPTRRATTRSRATAPHVGAARIIDISDEKRADGRLEHPARGEPARSTATQVGGDPGARARSRATPLTTAACRGGTTRASSPARSSVRACACSTSATRTTRGRSRTSSLRQRPARSSRSGRNYAMSSRRSTSAPAQSGTRDGNSGLYAVRLTNGAGRPGRRPAACAGAASCCGWPAASGARG